MSNKKHYVNNNKFYKALKEYKEDLRIARIKEEDPPKIPEYVGYCVYLIATRLAGSYNFIGYSYLDEMVSDAIETCIRYLDKFDTEKYDNPHAYFTTVCYNAFLFRMRREKKQTAIKSSMLKNYTLHNFLSIEDFIINNLGGEDFAYLQYLLEYDDEDKGKKDNSSAPRRPGRKSNKQKEQEKIMQERQDEIDRYEYFSSKNTVTEDKFDELSHYFEGIEE